MNSVRNLEFKQCRTCYNAPSNLQLLTTLAETCPSQTYAQLLLEVCNINIMDDEPVGRWPQFICLSCSNKLKLAHDFIQHTHQINEILKSIANVLQNGCESEFGEYPAYDVPLDIEIKKDEDLDFIPNEQKFQYGPLDTEVLKVEPTLYLDENEDHSPYGSNTSADCEYNKTIDNGTENSKEMLVSSNIEYAYNDIITEDALDKFHSKIVNEMDNTKRYRSTDLTRSSKRRLCAPATKTTTSAVTLTKSLRCNTCNILFSNISKLNRHKSVCDTSEEKKLSCPICGQKLARPDSLRRHIANVHKPKVLKKKKEIKISKSKTTVKKIKIVEKPTFESDLSEVTCNICGKTFLDHTRLVRHKRYVHLPEEKKVTCFYCGRKFGRPDNYQLHLRRMHWENLISPPKSGAIPNVNKYCCDLCHRSYARSSLLLKHEREVHGK